MISMFLKLMIFIAMMDFSHGVECDEGSFACNGTEMCIVQQKNCDGNEDCENGSDEWMCDDKLGSKYYDRKYRKRPLAEEEEFLPNVCAIEDFHHGACVCQENVVRCDHRFLKAVPEFSFAGEIRILDLRGNSLRSITEGDFRGFKRLSSLILSHAELQRVDKGAFRNVFKMKALFIDNNEIKELPRDWFNTHSSLETLRIGYNFIESIHAENFMNLSHLKELDLRYNKINAVSSTSLSPLISLEMLFLNNNEIKWLRKNSFPILPNLRSISLEGNIISNIEARSFASLENLRELFLTGNHLAELSSGVFHNLRRLEVLNINNNSIWRIDMDVFVPTSHLISLNLKLNKLKTLEKDVFTPATNLEYVYFDEFALCSAALRVRVCEPKGDGISSLHHLLDNPILRASVWIMCILACGGNLLVLLGRLLVKEPNAVHSLYIKNLSLSDLLMGIYLFVIAAADWKFRGNYVQHAEEWRHSNMCLVCGFINTLSSESSVLILSLITWDRLISVTKPLIQRQSKIKEASLHLFLLWASAIALAGAPLFGGEYFGPEFFTSNGVCLPLHIHDPYAQGWEYSAAMYIFLNAIALTMICVSYSKMLSVIRSSALALRSTQERQDRVVAQRFAVIVATDCFCWIPVIFIKIVALTGVAIPEDLYAWLAIFILPINSALNPILYTLTTKLFKQQISRLLYTCKQKQSENAAQASAMSLSMGTTPITHRRSYTRTRTTTTSLMNSYSGHLAPYYGTPV